MNLRISIILASCLFCGAAFAFTSDEAYKIAYEIVYRVSTSDECNDCYDEAFVNMKPTPYYPSVESVMEAMSRSTYTNLTVSEIAVAFDMFLDGIARTNATNVSERYLQTAGRALTLCEWKGYTNALVNAEDILRSGLAPCKEEAVDIVVSFKHPSMEKAELLFIAATNHSCIKERWRIKSAFECENVLIETTIFGTPAMKNLAKRFYESGSDIRNLVAVDRIVNKTFPEYALSSNRLFLCSVALSRVKLFNREIEYFTAITNELANAPQPLGGVPELDADSDESETE